MRIVLLVTMFLLVFTSPLFAQSPLFIGSAFEPPISAPGQKGIVDRIVREAFARIGKEVLVTPLPAERSLINADKGINDGDLIRVTGLQRHYPNLIQVSEKLIDFEFVAFHKGPHIRIENWNTLAPYSVGIVRGWKILERNLSDAHLTQVESLSLLFTLLEKGRTDVVVYERLAGLQAIHDLGLKDISQLEPPLEVQPMYLYLHKRHKMLIAPLIEALKAMKQDGTYHKIVADGLQPLLQRVPSWLD
ncbi:polar amino acid transport system substrate-binding protein [Desulfuromusa kysingii]|uniref:Polar amino acid transport system substrate-binding protein n=1 Tax=Desulfuromusa kysingii TaxID=37625 RepID=A0A1H4DK85_9BACT|nr:transporter substrate-binding domain-containing protein [Desulfuromusa kysingii]SEA72948.1 polar amino acid transport system substrate-binding protein [Desulfuromusa kysingii]